MCRRRCSPRISCLQIACLLLCWPAGYSVADVSPWVDIELIDNLLFVNSEIAGISGKTLIDTGAEVNGINGRFIAANDLDFPKGGEIKMYGAFGSDYRTTYREVPVSIFGADLTFEDLVEFDSGRPEVQLVIGAGFLKLLIFQFDYPHQRMRAVSRDAIDLKSLRNVESRPDPSGGSPIVRVNLNDEETTWVLLDTGFNGGIFLDRKIVEKRGWLERFPSVDNSAIGMISRANTQRFNLPMLKFGDYIIQTPLISVAARGEDAEFFKPYAYSGSRIPRRVNKAEGIMGYDVLKHFVVTIDYARGYIHIAPPAD